MGEGAEREARMEVLRVMNEDGIGGRGEDMDDTLGLTGKRGRVECDDECSTQVKILVCEISLFR